MPKEISAGIVVFHQEKGKINYLLLHAKVTAEFWGFTKGKVEKNETPESTALREVEEETGLKSIKLLPGFKQKNKWFYTREGKTIYKEAIYFLGETKTKDVKISKEHLGFVWCDLKEGLNKLKFDNDKELLKKAHKYLQKIKKQSLKRFVE